MTDELERLIGSVDSEGPSPEFMTRTRERIIQETELGQPRSASLITELDPRSEVAQHPVPIRWIVLAAAAIILIIGVVAGFDRSGIRRIEALEDPTPVFVEDAAQLPGAVALAEPGTYRVDTVGTPFAVVTDEPLVVRVNDPANVVLAHPAGQSSGDRELVFARLSALVDPARPIVDSIGHDEGWPADDFSGWIDTVGDEFLVSNRRAVTLGGRDALRVGLELGETGCPPGGLPCTVLGTNGSVTHPQLFPVARYQVWMVDMGSEDPLLILAGIASAADIGWFDTVESILLTLAFGDPGPNPILGSRPGPVETPLLGGVGFDLAEGSFVVRDPLATDRVELRTLDVHTGFVTNPRSAEGVSLTIADDVVAEWRSSGLEVTEIETTSVAGVATRVFDVVGPSSGPALLPASGLSGGWAAPARSQVWLIDHPARGLQMVTAEVDSDAIDVLFPVIVDHTEALLASLEFLASE